MGAEGGNGVAGECVFAQPAFHGRRQLVGPDGKAQKDQIVVGQVDLVGFQWLGAVLVIVQSQQVVGRALQGHQRGAGVLLQQPGDRFGVAGEREVDDEGAGRQEGGRCRHRGVVRAWSGKGTLMIAVPWDRGRETGLRGPGG